MNRDILAIVLCASSLGACQISVPPCGRNEERVIHTMCSCSDEHKQDPGHSCCRRDGGVCEDEELIPPARTSWPPALPKFGLWDFAVHPGELVETNNGTVVVPSAQNAVMPYICQPMFGKWAYANLTNGQLASSDELDLDPIFHFLGPSDGIEPRIKLEHPVPFDRIPYLGSVEKEVPVLGQDTEAFYYAEVIGLPPETPGDHYLSVHVSGTSDTWDEFEFDYCE